VLEVFSLAFLGSAPFFLDAPHVDMPPVLVPDDDEGAINDSVDEPVGSRAVLVSD
jgi:hypothetical protein